MILPLLVSCLWGVDLKRKKKKVLLSESGNVIQALAWHHGPRHITRTPFSQPLSLIFDFNIGEFFSSPESDAGTTALFLKLTGDRGRKWRREPCSFTWTANFQTDTMKFSHWRFFFFSHQKKKKKRFKRWFKDDSCTLATKQKATDSRRCFTSYY